jgi:hypothetical protein
MSRRIAPPSLDEGPDRGADSSAGQSGRRPEAAKDVLSNHTRSLAEATSRALGSFGAVGFVQAVSAQDVMTRALALTKATRGYEAIGKSASLAESLTRATRGY